MNGYHYAYWVWNDLMARLHWQDQRIAELTNRIAAITEDIEKLRKERPITVERIEYKFDQLKVDTLEGTLNIGISPNQGKTIEDLAVNGEQTPIWDENQARLLAETQAEINRYLNSDEFVRDLQALAAKHHKIVGTEYQKMMSKDLRKQIELRLIHYMNMLTAEVPDIPLPELKKRLIDLLRRDIAAAMEQHLAEGTKKEGPLK